MSRSNGHETTTYVFGGGGPFAMGYEFGIVEEFQNAGVDFSDSELCGTSAGSWVAGALATGKTFEDISSHSDQNGNLLNLRPTIVQELAEEVFGDDMAGNVHASVVKVPTCFNSLLRLRNLDRQEWLDGDDHPIAEIVAASSAVPTMFPPVHIDGSLYVDGGLRSGTSADRAPSADRLVVVAALAKHSLDPLRGIVNEVQARFEMGTWKRKHHGEVIYIRPDRQIGHMGQPSTLFDSENAKRAYDLAREQCEELIRYRPSIGQFVDSFND